MTPTSPTTPCGMVPQNHSATAASSTPMAMTPFMGKTLESRHRAGGNHAKTAANAAPITRLTGNAPFLNSWPRGRRHLLAPFRHGKLAEGRIRLQSPNPRCLTPPRTSGHHTAPIRLRAAVVMHAPGRAQARPGRRRCAIGREAAERSAAASALFCERCRDRTQSRAALHKREGLLQKGKQPTPKRRRVREKTEGLGQGLSQGRMSSSACRRSRAASEPRNRAETGIEAQGRVQRLGPGSDAKKRTRHGGGFFARWFGSRTSAC